MQFFLLIVDFGFEASVCHFVADSKVSHGFGLYTEEGKKEVKQRGNCIERGSNCLFINFQHKSLLFICFWFFPKCKEAQMWQ